MLIFVKGSGPVVKTTTGPDPITKSTRGSGTMAKIAIVPDPETFFAIFPHLLDFSAFMKYYIKLYYYV